MTLTGAQIRAGRALIRWSADDLAKAARVGIMTVRRAEAVDGPVPVNPANADAMQRALESAGVEFTNGGHSGVRLKGK